MGGFREATCAPRQCHLCGHTGRSVELVELPVGPLTDETFVPTPACESCAILYQQDRELERAELARSVAMDDALDARRMGER